MKWTFNKGLVFLITLLLQTNTVSAESLATLNGTAITDVEVETVAKTRMMKALSQMYDIKKEAINEIIDERLLQAEAKKLGKKPEQLIEDVANKAPVATDPEIETFYQMQKSRYFQDKSLDQVKTQIAAQLNGQKKRMAVSGFFDDLREKAQIKFLMKRPSVEVSVDDDPAQGPSNAPITLIEFSEFECPFCKRTRGTLDQVMETYKGKIRYVFRDFPLSFHKNARPAAFAANCAGEQGKYWEFNKALFDNQNRLGADLYKELATKLGLNADKFTSCQADANRLNQEINKDQSQGSEVGVTGTPAYFINGKFLSGAQPFEAFKEIIDEELANK